MSDNNMQKEIDENKRSFIKKSVYSAPVILSMTALPSFASSGSGGGMSSQGNKKWKRSKEHGVVSASGRKKGYKKYRKMSKTKRSHR